MKNQTEEWVLYADRDLEVAEILLKEEYTFVNIVIFHCQQAIEKYLKAFLIYNDVPLKKTHDLVKLNKMAVEIKDLFFMNIVYIA